MKLEDMKKSILEMSDEELETLILNSRKKRIEKDSDSRVKRVAKKQKSSKLLDLFASLPQEEKAKLLESLK